MKISKNISKPHVHLKFIFLSRLKRLVLILSRLISAWNIAHKSIKTCFDAIDNLEKPPYPIDALWTKIQEYFDIVNQADILNTFYGPFCKARIAGFCKEVANLASFGDPLSLHIFREAGRYIAKSIAAVYPKASSELTDRPDGLQVACVGSVWLSWNFLKEGFVEHIEKNTEIDRLSLIRVISPGGLGAAYMACDKLNIEVPRQYEKNFEILFRYKRN